MIWVFFHQKHKCKISNFLIQLPVITVVVRNASMHSVTNFFILNLAISDVIMCMVAVPFTPLMSFAGRITDHAVKSGEVIFQYLWAKSYSCQSYSQWWFSNDCILRSIYSSLYNSITFNTFFPVSKVICAKPKIWPAVNCYPSIYCNRFILCRVRCKWHFMQITTICDGRFRLHIHINHDYHCRR